MAHPTQTVSTLSVLTGKWGYYFGWLSVLAPVPVEHELTYYCIPTTAPTFSLTPAVNASFFPLPVSFSQGHAFTRALSSVLDRPSGRVVTSATVMIMDLCVFRKYTSFTGGLQTTSSCAASVIPVVDLTCRRAACYCTNVSKYVSFLISLTFAHSSWM